MKLKSVLTIQQIYDLKPTPNVLIYKDYKIPCICNFVGNNIVIECKMALHRPFIEKLSKQKYIDVGNLKFYVSDDYKYYSKIGEVVKLEFNLISKEPVEIEYIDLKDIVFRGGERK